MTNKSIVVKKYPNRRLYNTAISAYITLDDLAHLIQDNYDVIVIDAKTGTDITQITLINVILECQELGEKVLPINCLKQVIKLQGNSLGRVFTEYLSLSIDYFQKNQVYIENFINGMLKNQASADFWMQNLHFFQKQHENFLQMMNVASRMFSHPINKHEKCDGADSSSNKKHK